MAKSTVKGFTYTWKEEYTTILLSESVITTDLDSNLITWSGSNTPFQKIRGFRERDIIENIYINGEMLDTWWSTDRMRPAIEVLITLEEIASKFKTVRLSKSPVKSHALTYRCQEATRWAWFVLLITRAPNRLIGVIGKGICFLWGICFKVVSKHFLRRFSVIIDFFEEEGSQKAFL